MTSPNTIEAPLGVPDSAAGDVACAVSQSAASAASGVEAAEMVRDGLRAKLDAAKEALIDMDDRRQALAFEVHAHGGDAKRELDKLNKSRAAHVAEIETIEAAILESSRRVEDARRDEELAALGVKAERALEITAGLTERAKRLDDALALIAEESNCSQADLRELNHRLGCTHPNENPLESLGARALKAALMFSPFRWEHLPPHERRTFSELTSSWGLQIERWADARLPAKSEAAE